MPEDRAEGLAGESVAAGLNKPSQSTPDHAEAGDHAPSHRSLTGHEDPGRAGGSDGPGDGRREDRRERQGPARDGAG